MGLKNIIYKSLPSRLQPIAEVTYRQLYEKSQGADFVDTFFDSKEEYERLCSEAGRSNVQEVVEDALAKYKNLTAEGSFGSIDFRSGSAWYALVKKIKPSVVVETGVCNGVSSLFILQALLENGDGFLYSVDYPYQTDKDLEEFRDDTFDKYGGAAIPSDKEPGWIIPAHLQERWELRVGKSQVKLPALLEELEDLDLFIHDSEHSHPCMMFEYEMAWHQMKNGGVILSDDISWNNAFEVFCRVRDPVWGTLAQNENIGFMVKT